MIVLNRHIYQDPLSCPLGLAIFAVFINHTRPFSYHDSHTQICTHSYARLINEAHSVFFRMHLLISSTLGSSFNINAECCLLPAQNFLSFVLLCFSRTLWQVCFHTTWRKQRRHGQCAQLYLFSCPSHKEEPLGHHADCKFVCYSLLSCQTMRLLFYSI